MKSVSAGETMGKSVCSLKKQHSQSGEEMMLLLMSGWYRSVGCWFGGGEMDACC